MPPGKKKRRRRRKATKFNKSYNQNKTNVYPGIRNRLAANMVLEVIQVRNLVFSKNKSLHKSLVVIFIFTSINIDTVQTIHSVVYQPFSSIQYLLV